MEENKVDLTQKTNNKVFPNDIIKYIVIVCCVLGGLFNLAMFGIVIALFIMCVS